MGRIRWRQLFKLSLLLLVGIALVWLWIKLHNPSILPIKSVKFESSYQHITSQQLASRIQSDVDSGFFAVNVSQLRQHLLELPWVKRVNVSRVWPDTLVIRVTEQQAFARWGERQLISVEGYVFSPDEATIPSGLPALNGPRSQLKQVIEHYKRMEQLLASSNLHIVQLDLTQRHAWKVTLNNGMTVMLGRVQPIPRIQRFVKFYNKVIVTADKKADLVDLRYPNGLTVHWLNG